MTLAVSVYGATGRLGSHICELVNDAEDLTLHSALSSRSSLEEIAGADVVIDVTHIDASEPLVKYALQAGVPVVVGTSGWNAERLAQLAPRIPDDLGVLVVPNFSIGSVLGTHLSTIAARFFDDVEILEAHHASKVDAPSGTAVRTAERINEVLVARDASPQANADATSRGETIGRVPVHAMRLPGVVAEQRVIFGGTGETLDIRHLTTSSTAYDRGILLALRIAPEARGLITGLDELLELS